MRSVATYRKFRRSKEGRKDDGSSVITFVVALPLLLLFLFAVIDVGRTVFLHMALADAAYAACRVAVDPDADEVSLATLQKEALAASPALASDDLRLSIAVHYGTAEEETYEHHLYDESHAAFVSQESNVKRQEIAVDVDLEGHYLTPLGFALSSAQGRDDAGFAYKARSRGVADTTVGGLP